MDNAFSLIGTRLSAALDRADRRPDSCRLIAVTKTRGGQIVTEARRHGICHFGENKVQEAQEKFPPSKDRAACEALHLIGPLQSNKVRQAVRHFDAIHTVDRPKLITRLVQVRAEEGRCPALFIQVNTGEEPQKAGVLPVDLDTLVALARAAKLPLVGLMCIPPADQAPAPHFAWLALRAQQLGLHELSMGMSGDFEAAVELGATYVRVGSALFGARL